MCQHHASVPNGPAPHRAISLDHGTEHDRDHAAWTRRDFLTRMGFGAAGAAVFLGNTTARALGRSPLFDALARLQTDRVIVLVQLSGGNDGLNTVVPVTNDLYYQARPTLALSAAQTIRLSNDYGLHPAFAPLESFWGDGQLAVVHAVGYPDPSLSHFRATDIWYTATDSNVVGTTGWAGRGLDALYPFFEDDPPLAPPAVQLGTSAPLLFQGPEAGYAMAMFDIETFLEIAAGGTPYDPEDVPPTPGGEELGYVRTVANDAFRYREAIYNATEAAQNEVPYPETGLAAELAAVARLIKGRLDTRIYLVSLGGFDTHASQAEAHTALFGELSGALAAFFADLAVTGDDLRTVALTFSEFGRRVEENGSLGTDHGTAAPLFFAGRGVTGGLVGQGPDLANLDPYGNLLHTTDFRRVYATALQTWLGLDAVTTAAVLGGSYQPLPILLSHTGVTAQVSEGSAFETVTPNPLYGRAAVGFSLSEAGPVRLTAYDMLGRQVAVVADGMHAAGRHQALFDATGLPSGTYVLRLEAAGHMRTHKVTVVR